MSVDIVVDTNLLVAGRWRKKSASYRIIKLCLEGVLTPVYTKEIRSENMYILEKVKSPPKYMELVGRFYESGVLVESGERISASRDESDNRFIEAAVAGDADYILSNDSDLLELVEYEGIKIVRPGRLSRMIP